VCSKGAFKIEVHSKSILGREKRKKITLEYKVSKKEGKQFKMKK
jgi:hypothetical protein